MKRKSTIIVALLVMLSLLGGRFGHGQAHDCAHSTPVAVHTSHAHHYPSAGTDPIHHAASFSVSCDGLFCPMNGCCFPRSAAPAIGMPRTISSAIPLLLATDASGTGPAEVEHPPQVS
jgi:hypothetical protein